MVEEVRRVMLLFVAVVFVVVTTSFVFSQALAPSQPTDVNITVAGAVAPQIVFVSPIVNPTPIENTFTTVTFDVHMSDADGVNNLDDGSVSANFTRGPSEVLREDTSCVFVNDIDTTTANYSCSINMWYFDGPGQWNVTARGTDVESNIAINDTTSFNFQLLKAIVISPSLLTFPTVSPNSFNQSSDNDPTTVNNTGNDQTAISVTGVDLYGEVNPGFTIPAANFSVDAGTGTGTECAGTLLVNGTSTSIAGSSLPKGNLSLGSGTAQEDLFYCIRKVPGNLESQAYSTSQGSSWVLSI